MKRYIAKVTDVQTQKVLSSGIFRTSRAANLYVNTIAKAYKLVYPDTIIRQTVDSITLPALIRWYLARVAT